MGIYTAARSASNTVTNISDYRRPKPSGFIGDDPLSFACGTRVPDADFIRRNRGCFRAALDYAEGARRDAFSRRRHHGAFTARVALPDEYRGARIAAGLSPSRRGTAVVVSCFRWGALQRYIVPLRGASPGELEGYVPLWAAEQWWASAVRRAAFDPAVVHDVLPIEADA